jgi:LacI family transcriptional regulator
VEHLVALGHRRVGYIEISKRELNPWRYAGYAAGLRAAGLELDERLVVGANCSFEGGRRAAGELLDQPEPPSAILAFSEVRAWGAWRAAEERGLRVGRDLALVTFSGGEVFGESLEGLSAVESSFEELGRVAGGKLEELMAGGSEPGGLTKVRTKLVVRESSGGPRGAPGSESEGGSQS